MNSNYFQNFKGQKKYPPRGTPAARLPFQQRRRPPQLTLFNYFLEYGKALHESDIMISYSPTETNKTFQSKTARVQYVVEGTNLNLERDLDYLQDLKQQDFPRWIQNFKDTIKLCS